VCVYGAQPTHFGTTHPNSPNLRRVLTLVVFFLSVPAGGGEGTHCISPRQSALCERQGVQRWSPAPANVV